MMASRSVCTSNAARRLLGSGASPALRHPSRAGLTISIQPLLSSSLSASSAFPFPSRPLSVAAAPSKAAKVDSPSPGTTKERVPSNKVNCQAHCLQPPPLRSRACPHCLPPLCVQIYDTPAEALKASGLKDGQTLSVTLPSHICSLLPSPLPSCLVSHLRPPCASPLQSGGRLRPVRSASGHHRRGERPGCEESAPLTLHTRHCRV